MRAGRREEYASIQQAAESLVRSRTKPAQFERELSALRRGLARTVERDHFASAGRASAQRALQQASRRKEE